ncbi:hypothetical protein ACFQI7_12435 [Paenibacillus allorhizosphaerae]|uniref:Uncharacterized protein n=1 Tax=Paenibacillus allorhizosphaerae TaxID=2849866 RepID=A0ABM8VLJ5_9BACL|nr:hypothetical protein [Paenibacillus allorhizosphaerae]CAG7648577.1 hypothetical protein PAECIP111802_04253 [Paenibacillus allorhizosphaerae]
MTYTNIATFLLLTSVVYVTMLFTIRELLLSKLLPYAKKAIMKSGNQNLYVKDASLKKVTNHPEKSSLTAMIAMCTVVDGTSQNAVALVEFVFTETKQIKVCHTELITEPVAR